MGPGSGRFVPTAGCPDQDLWLFTLHSQEQLATEGRSPEVGGASASGRLAVSGGASQGGELI